MPKICDRLTMTAGTEVVREDVVCKAETENKSDSGLGMTNLNKVGGSADSDGAGSGNGKKDDSDYSSYVFVSKNVEVTGDDPAEMGGVNGHSGSADEVEQVKKEESGTENGEIAFDSLELEDACIDHSAAGVKGFEVQAVKEEVNLDNGSAVDSSVVLETNGIAQDSVDSHLGEITGLVVTRTDEVEDVNEIAKVEPEMDDPKSRIKVGLESTPNTTDSSQVTDFESEATPKLIEDSKSEVKITHLGSTSNAIVAVDEPHSAVNPVGNTDPEVKVNDVLESNGDLIEKEECQVTFDGLESTGKPADKMDHGVTADGSASFGDPIETPEFQVSVCGSESTENPTENQECQVSVDVLESNGNPIEKEECQVTFDGLKSTGRPTDKMDSGVTVDGSESSGDAIETPECQVSVCGSESTENPTENQECQVSVDVLDSNGDLIEKEECQVTFDGLESTGKPTDKMDHGITVDGSESSGDPIETPECQVSVCGSESTETLTENQECQVSVCGSESTENPTKNQECQVSADVLESTGKPIENAESWMTGAGSAGVSEECKDSSVLMSKVDVEAEPNHVSGGLNVEHQRESESTFSSEDQKAGGTVTGLDTESEESPGSVIMPSKAADVPANPKEEELDLTVELGKTEMSQSEADERELSEVGVEKIESKDQVDKQVEESSESVVEDAHDDLEQAKLVETKEQVEIVDENKGSQIVVSHNAQNDLYPEVDSTQSAGDTGAPLELKTTSKPINEVASSQNENVSSRCFDEAEITVQLKGSAENEEILPSTDFVISECETADKENDLLSNPSAMTLTEQQVECGAPPVADTSSAEATDCGTEIENLDVPDERTQTEVKDAPVGGHLTLPLESTSKQIDEVANSQNENASSRCFDEAETAIELKGSVENEEILPSTDFVKSECKTADEEKDLLSNPGEMTLIEQQVECGASPVADTTSVEATDCGTEIENLDVPDDERTQTEVEDAPVGGHSTLTSPDEYSSPGTAIQFGSIGRHEKTPTMYHDSVNTVANVIYGESDPACGADSDNPEQNHNGSEGEKTDDKVTCQEDEGMDGIPSDMTPISSVEDCRSDVTDGQNEEAEVLPYNFLIRIPRFEDEKLREQIKEAQLQVDMKTELRDAIRAEIYGKRARLKAHNEDFNAAKSVATAARRLVRLKRQDIDSVQCVINRVKNALSVEDIDRRIHNMEHMMQHETLRLNEEKQYIREMKQLKTLRDQLASNMGSQDEVQQALAQKDQIEERLKILKKELDSLKNKVSKAEATAIAVGKLFDEERKKEKELQSQFRAADDVRQEAYAHLNSLKKQFYDKNKSFRMYKKDTLAARDFASRGDKNSLHRLCANQVETFMELWNTNDEFRKEYVNSININASRRGRILLGPDEVPPMQPNYVDGRADRSLISEDKSMSVVSTVEQGKKDSSFEDGHTDDKVLAKLPGKKNEMVKTIELAAPTLGSDPAGEDEAADEIIEEEKMLTKEELELAMKAEELRKEEIAAKLKEQRRLEEKAKEMEALERKKRHAEKAQKRAELRAQKEAEQKEKERERRLRKKEKKKAGGEGSGEDAAAAAAAVNTENANEAAVKENRSLTSKKAQKPPAHFFSKQLKPKPIPPPLAIRQKKRWHHWAKLLVTALVVIALFLLGNTGFFLNLRHLNSNATF